MGNPSCGTLPLESRVNKDKDLSMGIKWPFEPVDEMFASDRHLLASFRLDFFFFPFKDAGSGPAAFRKEKEKHLDLTGTGGVWMFWRTDPPNSRTLHFFFLLLSQKPSERSFSHLQTEIPGPTRTRRTSPAPQGGLSCQQTPTP